MIDTAIGIVKDELNKIGIPYCFMRWTESGTPPKQYWVGEFMETPTGNEDGYEEGTLLLTGTNRASWLVLMEDRRKIKDHFPSISGLRLTTADGSVVIFYENSFPVPTGEADLNRIQVNLHIKMWKGMN